MDPNFWIERWKAGQIGFHQQEINPPLRLHEAKLGEPNGRIFVPLAGKSNDMAWLASRGHEVVGIELSEIAVRAFFQEHSLEPEILTQGSLTRFVAGGVTLFCGDFFALTNAVLNEARGVTAVYDRAAYFALPSPLRQRYVEHMASLLSPGARTLLLTIVYDEALASGPPFSISNEEVMRAYSPWFSLEKLSEGEVDVANARLQAAGILSMRETAWMLSRKGKDLAPFSDTPKFGIVSASTSRGRNSMSNDDNENRRRTERHIACVLAHVQREEGSTRSAVIRDISVEGALIFTRAHLDAGQKVQLSLYLDGDGSTAVVAEAEVVRAGPRPRSVADVWPYSAAVKFLAPLDVLEEKLATIAEQQARVFGSDF